MTCKYVCIQTRYAHNSISWLYIWLFKWNHTIFSRRPQLDKYKKIKYMVLGKGKEWRLHENLCSDWVSCKAVSKCIKDDKALEALEKEKFFFSYRYCDTVSFLLNIISHAVHANEQTDLVLSTMDVFITSIKGIVIISILHWTSWTSRSVFFSFLFFFWWPLR